MDKWNYRVVRQTGEGMGVMYGIHEAYYDGEKIVGVSEFPTEVWGESPEELKADLERMMLALDKPIIDIEGNEIWIDKNVP